MPLSLTDVGQGGSDSFHCRQRYLEELDCSRGRQAIEPTNETAPYPYTID
jgi:hypothetical protein